MRRNAFASTLGMGWSLLPECLFLACCFCSSCIGVLLSRSGTPAGVVARPLRRAGCRGSTGYGGWAWVRWLLRRRELIAPGSSCEYVCAGLWPPAPYSRLWTGCICKHETCADARGGAAVLSRTDVCHTPGPRRSVARARSARGTSLKSGSRPSAAELPRWHWRRFPRPRVQCRRSSAL